MNFATRTACIALFALALVSCQADEQPRDEALARAHTPAPVARTAKQAAPREVTFDQPSPVAHEEPVNEPVPPPEELPEISREEPEPLPPAPDPVRVDEVIATCDEEMIRAMYLMYEGEGDPYIVPSALREVEDDDVPNQSVGYRSRTSARADIWRLEYNLVTGDCRGYYYYGDMKFMELDRPPRRPGIWRARRVGEHEQHIEVYEVDGVRVVITDVEESKPLRRAAEACIKALTTHTLANTPE